MLSVKYLSRPVPLSLALLMYIPSLGRAAEVPRIDICDFFREPSTYAGKMLAIRGEIAWGYHGVWMNADRRCPTVVETQGIRWAASIIVKGPDAPDLSLSPDLKSLEFFRQLLSLIANVYEGAQDRELAYGPVVGMKVTATFVGIVRISRTYGSVVHEDHSTGHKFLAGGFGEGGRWPADIARVAVEDVTITGLHVP